MRETPSRKSAQATVTLLPNAHAVGSVITQKLPPGKTGKPPAWGSDAPSGVMPVAGWGLAVQVSPPSVETCRWMSPPAIEATYTVPSSETLISGKTQPSVKVAVIGGDAPGLAPIQLVPWFF